jgi:hypothetical protein
MTSTTSLAARANGRIAVSLACLAAGALFGLLSVYSDSRASCALWVAVALALALVSGLLFPSRRPRA